MKTQLLNPETVNRSLTSHEREFYTIMVDNYQERCQQYPDVSFLKKSLRNYMSILKTGLIQTLEA